MWIKKPTSKRNIKQLTGAIRRYLPDLQSFLVTGETKSNAEQKHQSSYQLQITAMMLTWMVYRCGGVAKQDVSLLRLRSVEPVAIFMKVSVFKVSLAIAYASVA